MNANSESTQFVDEDHALRRRGTDPALEIIAHKVTKMEASMDRVAEALVTLALVEERQNNDRAALERAFAAIQSSEERSIQAFEKAIAKLEKVEARVDTLEQAAPITSQTNRRVENAIWAAAAAAGMYVAKKVGLL